MKETYNIEDVALMTGLSTRTIRTYLSAGFLEGDKSGGSWQFTAEQVGRFMEDPAIRPAVHAKRNAIVYDYLSSLPSDAGRMCVVLDLPKGKAEGASAFFCKAMCAASPSAQLRFASEPVKGGGTRVILSGNEEDVSALMDGYRAWKKEA